MCAGCARSVLDGVEGLDCICARLVESRERDGCGQIIRYCYRASDISYMQE